MSAAIFSQSYSPAQRPRDCGGRAVVPRAHNTPASSDSGDSMLAPPSGSCSRPSRRWPRRIPHVFFIFLNFNLSRASRPPHRAPTPRVGRCQSCLLVIVSQCLLSSARSHAPVTNGQGGVSAVPRGRMSLLRVGTWAVSRAPAETRSFDQIIAATGRGVPPLKVPVAIWSKTAVFTIPPM